MDFCFVLLDLIYTYILMVIYYLKLVSAIFNEAGLVSGNCLSSTYTSMMTTLIMCIEGET